MMPQDNEHCECEGSKHSGGRSVKCLTRVRVDYLRMLCLWGCRKRKVSIAVVWIDLSSHHSCSYCMRHSHLTNEATYLMVVVVIGNPTKEGEKSRSAMPRSLEAPPCTTSHLAPDASQPHCCVTHLGKGDSMSLPSLCDSCVHCLLSCTGALSHKAT